MHNRTKYFELFRNELHPLCELIPVFKWESTLIEIFNVLYVDNGAFPFEDRDQLSKGVQFISEKFKIFGPVIHIERGAKPSRRSVSFFFAAGILQTQVDINSYEEWCD